MKRSVKHSPMHAAEVGAIVESVREALGLSQEGLARVLGVSVRTVVRWEREGDEPPPLERERLELIREIVEIAKDVTPLEALPEWFSTPKRSLSGERPLDLLSSFKGIQQLRETLERTRWGIF